MTLMAQRIWSCGCLPGSDCQVNSAKGGFKLVADIRDASANEYYRPRAGSLGNSAKGGFRLVAASGLGIED